MQRELYFRTGFVDYDKSACDENAKKFMVNPIVGRERIFYDFDQETNFDRKAFELVNARLWQAHERRKQTCELRVLVMQRELYFRTGFVDYDKSACDENAKKFMVNPIVGRERIFYDFDQETNFDRKAFELVNARLWQAHERRKQTCELRVLVMQRELYFRTGFVDYDKSACDENAKKFMVNPIVGRERIFYDFDQETNFDRKAFELVNARLWQAHERRKQVFPGAYLALGGSTVNRFGTRGSDLDLCLAIRCGEDELYDESVSYCVLSMAKGVLEEKPFVSSVILVAARVPILKLELKFPFNGVEVDINCNCVAGIFNSHLLRYYAGIDKRVPAMITYFKDWAADVKVVDPKFGGVNSYTIMLMVIHFLQCGVDPPILPNLVALYPDLFSGAGNVEDLKYNVKLDLPRIEKNTRSLGELMYGFLNYYEQFDYENAGISIREARLFDRRRRPHEDARFLFFIEEAYDGLTVPKNLTRQRKLDQIRRCFEEGRNYLLVDLLGTIPRHLMANTTHDYDDYDRERDYFAPNNDSVAVVGNAPWTLTE